MLTDLAPEAPALAQRLGGAHSRFARLVAEAEPRARAFYRRIFQQELGIEAAVARIFAEVEAEGDGAVARFNQAFDACPLPADRLIVPQEQLAAALANLAGPLRQALELAETRITAYQRRLLPRDFGTSRKATVGARWTPLDRVAAYVPGGAGGSVPLCSTVLMNLVPARVAGVRQLVVLTPPRPDGTVAPALLAAACLAGATTVYLGGGVQGIAAAACGTPSLPAVDKIVGPGNLFVTLAKRQAYGRVDIDMLAGPSEVLILADGSAQPRQVAADLLSQAEHDPLAMAVLLALDDRLATAVQAELARQVASLPEASARNARLSLERQGLLVRCTRLEQAVDLANRFAPEHLELLLADPEPALAAIRHAGAIFVGPWSPEPIGDYVAGPSHTLPTGGTARYWSGIGADTFLKRTSLIRYDRRSLSRQAAAATTLARAEGLEAHARSIESRDCPGGCAGGPQHQ